jgi:hypothetical protein
MGFILDMQDLDTPEAPANVMAGGGSGGGGGGGSTTASNASLLLPCSHSTVSLVLCCSPARRGLGSRPAAGPSLHDGP